jgi:hypothetical protein
LCARSSCRRVLRRMRFIASSFIGARVCMHRSGGVTPEGEGPGCECLQATGDDFSAASAPACVSCPCALRLRRRHLRLHRCHRLRPQTRCPPQQPPAAATPVQAAARTARERKTNHNETPRSAARSWRLFVGAAARVPASSPVVQPQPARKPLRFAEPESSGAYGRAPPALGAVFPGPGCTAGSECVSCVATPQRATRLCPLPVPVRSKRALATALSCRGCAAA